MYPTVALIGRPNVGKSTIFNRLIHEKKAVISDIPGTTRDIISEVCTIGNRDIFLIDTGGIMKNGKEDTTIEIGVQEQTQVALEEADIIVFILDSKVGIFQEDREILKNIRKSGKKFFIVVNKTDNENEEKQTMSDFAKLGCEFCCVSSIHNYGFSRIEENLNKMLKDFNYTDYTNESEDIDFKICLVGKPNAGKSSIINAITGKKVSLVSEIAGTTRDSIDTDVRYEDHNIKIVDTAGLRKKSKISDDIEFFSYLRAVRSMHSSDIVVIITDATNPIAHYEKTLLGEAEKLKKGCLLVVNKWDLIEKESSTMAEYQAYLRAKIPFLKWLPIVFTSAQENKRLDSILKEVVNIQSERKKKLSTSVLNKILDEAKISHPPSALNSKKKHPKMYYITQTDTEPPTFTIFVNDKQIMHASYMRYIEKQFREVFGFYGTPVKFELKNRPRNR